MPREIFQPKGLSDPRPRYSQLSRFGKLVYVAGQLALDANGSLVGKGDIQAQTRQVFENIQKCLEAVGAGFDNVVKINVYLTDIRQQLGAVAKVRQEYFTSAAVPSTTVEVSRLAHPDALLEIEAIAVLD
ncbi:MAG: RidA family protein [Candidatus Tectomicrobia bacterium]|nr:RidA family protein [Candidatus Tectomicrobia bacterium]